MKNTSDRFRHERQRKTTFLVAVMGMVILACGLPSAAQQNTRGPVNTSPPVTHPPDPTQPLSPDDLAIHGGGPITPHDNPNCNGNSPSIALCSYGGNSLSATLTLPGTGAEVAVGEWLVVSGCNFQQGKPVSINYQLPDGSSQESSVVPAGQIWSKAWWITPDKPLGSYRLDVRSSEKNFSKEFSVVTPSQPILTTGPSQSGSEAAIVLSGFRPQEKVLLAAYILESGGATTTLSDHRYVTMDANGARMDRFPSAATVMVAIGQQMPETYGFDPGPMAVSAFDFFSGGMPSNAGSGRFTCSFGGGGPVLRQTEKAPEGKLYPAP